MRKRYILGMLFALLAGACSDKTPDSTKPPEQANTPAHADSLGVQGDAGWRSVIHISDPVLLREIHDFTWGCYNTAHYFLSDRHPELSEAQIKDTQWIGSRYFLETPDYYDALHKDDANGPTCKEWWSDEKQGLYARLLKAVDKPELLAGIGDWVEPLPQLETVADFQKFVEQVITCQNDWANEVIIKHGDAYQGWKIQKNDLELLEKRVQKLGFSTELSLDDNSADGYLIIRPQNQKISILGANLKEIGIYPYTCNAAITATLDAEETEMLEKFKAFGLKQSPAFKTQYNETVGPYFVAAENNLSKSHGEGYIDVRKLSQDGTQQKPSVVGCIRLPCMD